MEIFLHSFLNSVLDGDVFRFMDTVDLTPGITPVID